MAASWFIERQGKESGPYTGQQLKELAASGKLRRTDLVRRQDQTKAVPAERVNGLFPARDGKAQAVPPPASPPAVPTTPRPAGLHGKGQPSPPAKDRDQTPAPPGQAAVTSSRHTKVVVILGVLLAGSCMISVVAGVVKGLAGKQGQGPVVVQNAGQTGNDSSERPAGAQAENKDAGAGSADAHPAPDFSKVDYEYDFAKDDYKAIPAGATAKTQRGPIGQTSEDIANARWETCEGYVTQDGKFVRHGRRTLWLTDKETTKCKEEMWFNDKLHGLQTVWNRSPTKGFKKGEKLLEGTFVHGERHGLVRSWYSTGELKAESYFYHGKEHGIRTEFSMQGKKVAESPYVEGKLHGKKRIWSDKSNLVVSEADYVDGVLHGDAKDWDDLGRLLAEKHYDHGKPSGMWRLAVVPLNGGAVYYMETPAGVWKGGTKHEFFCRMCWMVSKRIYRPNEGYFRAYVPHGEFITIFGEPASKRSYSGPDTWQEVWTYRCSDGTVSFHLATDGQTINLETGS